MKVPFNTRYGSIGQEELMRRMGRTMAFGSGGVRSDQMTDEVKEARKNRHINARAGFSRTAATGGSGGGFADIQFATGRPRDPLFYWRQNNLPYDFSQNEELAKVRSFCRLLYQTDPIIGSCVDIFSKFPVLGFELTCKDDKLTEFYQEQFFDEDHLDYEEFLVDIGREYWTVGESWPFATFNEDLGIWDDEELLNPDDIKVERSPFLKEPRYFIKLPWTIRQILQTRQPAWEYNKLIQEYPELAAYTSENAYMPVSNILLQQLKFKGDTFNVRGVPLLTRAMRPMLQQEMLNTALDSIADRLYTPLILCKLGASATDLGTSVPWIPTDDDLESFELALDAALAGDFRALIHNFAVEIEPVFGRENMPDLTPDFERIEDRVLQVFGLSRTFLMGADGGETYAADALNKELVTQLMTRYQKYLTRHFRRRALIVAEAQEHYDFEERAGKRYVVMEEVLEEDEETGEKRIIEQPKLLIPDLRFKTLNFKDEDLVRQFTEALRESGVPVSMRTRTRNLDFDLDDEIQRSQDEAVQLAVAEQETRKQTFIALRDGGYPIPDDLMADFAPMAQMEGVPPMVAAEMIMAPRLGTDPLMLPNLAPNAEDMGMAEELEQEEGEGADEGSTDSPGDEPEGGPDDEGGGPGDGEPQRPEESDEQRSGMPMPGGGKTRVHSAVTSRTASSLTMRRVVGGDGAAIWVSAMTAAPDPGVSYTYHPPKQEGMYSVIRAHHPAIPAEYTDPETGFKWMGPQAGSISWDPKHKTIESIGVHPLARRTGIATELLRRALEHEPQLRHSREVLAPGYQWLHGGLGHEIGGPAGNLPDPDRPSVPLGREATASLRTHGREDPSESMHFPLTATGWERPEHERRHRPPESLLVMPGHELDERDLPSRPATQGMPDPASLFRRTARVRDAVASAQAAARADDSAPAQPAAHAAALADALEWHRPQGDAPFEAGPQVRSYADPPHVGIRRVLGLTRGDVLPDDSAA